jgi:signal transduction histidine kinase
VEETVRSQQQELERSRAELRALTQKLFSAQEDERQHIARELHDDHCQRITALIFEMMSLARLVEGIMPDVKDRIVVVQERLAHMLDDFRHLAHQLHPPHFEVLSLAQSMRNYLEEFEAHAGLHVEFRERKVPVDLPKAIVLTLYRLLQESLENIAKHARATTVFVTLTGMGDGIRMRVVDDGRGFDLGGALAAKKGIGLLSMNERVRQLGGSVMIDSRPGRGARIQIFLPVRLQIQDAA